MELSSPKLKNSMFQEGTSKQKQKFLTFLYKSYLAFRDDY